MNTSRSDELQRHLKYLDAIFTIRCDAMNNIMKAFHLEMENGLSGAGSSIKMLPSFIGIPKGSENGRFLTLDLGGTNFRVLAVDLLGGGKTNIFAVKKFVIPKKVMQGSGQQLFNFIAESIPIFFEKNKMEKTRLYDLAFTFSFPVKQAKIGSGKLIKWTKGFTATGVEGRDVMELLLTALKKKKITYIRPIALVNDTVGTLVSKCYSEPSCDIGVILGTGMNACYLEKRAKIKKLHGTGGPDQMIINMECGNFDKIPQTSFDLDLDKDSPNPGAQKMEKMVSGMYLGEILRTVILEMIQKEILFNHVGSCTPFMTKGGLETRHMSAIEADTSSDLHETAKLLAQNGMINTRLGDRIILKKICRLVSARSATIAATAISAIVTWMDPDFHQHHTVGIDGSLFEKYSGYKDIMEGIFPRILNKKEFKISLQQSKDGSGKGAAVIAAMAASLA